MVEHDLGGKRVEPHEVLGHLALGFVEVAVRLNDVGGVGGFSTPLHPWLPGFERTIRLDALNRHVFVVAFEANHLRMGAQEVDEAGGVRATVDHVAQAHHPVLGFEVQSMQERPEGRQMPVDVTQHKDTVAVVKTCLQIGFERGVAKRRSKGEIQLATQAVHRRDGPFGQRLFESLYVLPPIEGGQGSVFRPFLEQWTSLFFRRSGVILRLFFGGCVGSANHAHADHGNAAHPEQEGDIVNPGVKVRPVGHLVLVLHDGAFHLFCIAVLNHGRGVDFEDRNQVRHAGRAGLAGVGSDVQEERGFRFTSDDEAGQLLGLHADLAAEVHGERTGRGVKQAVGLEEVGLNVALGGDDGGRTVVHRDALDFARTVTGDVSDGVAAHIHLVARAGQEATGCANEGLGRDEAVGGRHHGVVAPGELGRTVLGEGLALVAVASLTRTHGVVRAVAVGDGHAAVQNIPEVGLVGLERGPTDTGVHAGLPVARKALTGSCHPRSQLLKDWVR